MNQEIFQSLESPFNFFNPLKPRKAVQSTSINIARVHHISTSDLHQIIWMRQDLIAFVSGTVIVQYNIMTEKSKIITRNNSQGDIYLFKSLKHQFNHSIVGYITLKDCNRYQFNYRLLNNWAIVSSFKLNSSQSILDCLMLDQNCFIVIVVKYGKKKLLFFREQIQIQYKVQQNFVNVFSAESDKIIIVNKNKIVKITFDSFLLGDVSIVSEQKVQSNILIAVQIKDQILLMTQKNIFLLHRDLKLIQVSCIQQIKQPKSIDIRDNYIMFIYSNHAIRYNFYDQIHMAKNKIQYVLDKPKIFHFDKIQRLCLSPSGKQLMVKQNQQTKIHIVNIQSFCIHSFFKEIRKNEIPLDYQSNNPIKSIQSNLSRPFQVFYLDSMNLYNNNRVLLLQKVLCYSISDDGIFLIAAFKHYLKIYCIGKDKLFLVEAHPMSNILDVKFCYGNRFLVLTKQQIKVYFQVPSNLIFYDILSNSKRYQSMVLSKQGKQVVVFQSSGNLVVYSILNFQKLKEIKLTKLIPIMYDINSYTILSVNNSKINIYNFLQHTSQNFEYMDLCVVTTLKIVQSQGFLLLTTNNGYLRVHNWPPQERFFSNYTQFKIFECSITSSQFDSLNSMLYLGSQFGVLLSIKMIFQNQQIGRNTGILQKLYVQSKKSQSQHLLQIKCLQQTIQQSRNKYVQQISILKKLKSEHFKSNEVNMIDIYEANKQIALKVNRKKREFYERSQKHEQEILKIEQQNKLEIIRMREIGRNIKIQIQQIKSKHIQLIQHIKLELETQIKQSKGKIQNDKHKHKGIYKFATTPDQQTNLFQQVQNQLAQDDMNLFNTISEQTLSILDNQIQKETKRNFDLRSLSSSLISNNLLLQQKTMKVSELNFQIIEKLKQTNNNKLFVTQSQQYSTRLLEINKSLQQPLQKNYLELIKIEQDQIHETQLRLISLERFNKQIVGQEIELVNTRYQQLNKYLKQEYGKKQYIQKQILEKKSLIEKLKVQLKCMARKNFQIGYQFGNCRTQILKTQQVIGKQNKHRKTKSKEIFQRHATVTENDFFVQRAGFRTNTLQKRVKITNSQIKIRNNQNQNLLVQSYRLKKQSMNSEIYLKSLKQGFTKSQIQKIQAKNQFKLITLKPTPFQEYQKRKIFHTHTHSSPISRSISRRQL